MGYSMENDIIKVVPVYCNACGGSTHKITYFGVEYYECDDVDCGWMLPASEYDKV